MTNIKNKIEASDKSIDALLKDQKFFIDYFQREYRWQEKHMVALIEDLTDAFLQSYKPTDKRSEVANYQSYYLGPVVFSITEGKNSIIDGQQRITSITLFLIYLNHLQEDFNQKVNVASLVFSEKYGEKSFNMTDEDRQGVLKALYEEGTYEIRSDDDETVQNIAHRYYNIHKAFPEEIDEHALPFFIDWLIGNVVLVKITAYSDENAYTIFETMNDRGMNLTSTEMLKGYVLSRIDDRSRRSEINEIWKNAVQRLHEIGETSDLEFFKAWFRAKYAITVRPRKVDSENQDFEQIGTRFHDWFKNNHQENLKISGADDFYQFFKKEFVYMVNAYATIWEKKGCLDKRYPHIYYADEWGIADSLQMPMLLASLSSDDNEQQMLSKMDVVARFIETYAVRRAINFRKFSASSIQYTFFNIIKSIRNLSFSNLSSTLQNEIDQMEETFDAVSDFYLHQQNYRFVKHLLCRITHFIDIKVGRDTSYDTYYNPDGKQFEIEHLWSDHFDQHRDEFEQEWEFSRARNSIGALILLPNGTNQSFNSDAYPKKILHYLKENVYAQTLHPEFYFKNPNFKNSGLTGVPFQAHEEFKLQDIKTRTEVVKALCKIIWSSENFTDKKS